MTRMSRSAHATPRLLLGVGIALLLLAPQASRPLGAFPGGADRGWTDVTPRAGAQILPYSSSLRTSRYVTMRDGVRVAVDLYLPKELKAGEKIPAIFMQTRYARSLHGRWPFRRLVKGRFAPLIEAFARRGYAWVFADARGSGASFGTRGHPYSDDEIADAGELLDWIEAQPWSDGKVGAWGSSYTGGSALRLAATGHKALRAIMPRFAMFDMYADAVFPGGLQLRWLTDAWGRLARALDGNRPQDYVGFRARLATKGISPVDDDPTKGLLAQAVAGHAANGDIATLVKGIEFRDDSPAGRPGITLDRLSPHSRLDALKASGIGMYFVSGWMDAAFIRSQAHLYMNLAGPKTKLTIGPWDHGGFQNISPAARRSKPRFDHIGEALRFFDHHLKGVDTGIHDEAPVHYFTMVEEAWKTAPTWPPPGTKSVSFFMAPEGRLSAEVPTLTPRSNSTQNEAADDYLVDLEVGSGDRSRWNSLINLKHRAIRYRGRARIDKRLLVYETAPLPEAREVTGHPLAKLWLSSSESDGAIFVYLEDVDLFGRVTYVTEGLLRARHRTPSRGPAPYVTAAPYRSHRRAEARALQPKVPTELIVELFPTSYRFKAGHRIRVAIAGADKDHFDPVTEEAPRLRVHRGRDHASSIELPIMPIPEETP